MSEHLVSKVAHLLAEVWGVKILDEVDQQLFERAARIAIVAVGEHHAEGFSDEAWRHIIATADDFNRLNFDR